MIKGQISLVHIKMISVRMNNTLECVFIVNKRGGYYPPLLSKISDTEFSSDGANTMVEAVIVATE